MKDQHRTLIRTVKRSAFALLLPILMLIGVPQASAQEQPLTPYEQVMKQIEELERIGLEYREQRNACFLVLDDTKSQRDKCEGERNAFKMSLAEIVAENGKLRKENYDLKARKIPKRYVWFSIGAGTAFAIVGGVILAVALK